MKHSNIIILCTLLWATTSCSYGGGGPSTSQPEGGPSTSQPEGGPSTSQPDATPTPLVVSIVSPTDPLEVTEGALLDFAAEVEGGTAPYSFNWDFGTMAPVASIRSPKGIRVSDSGSHTCTLTVTDIDGTRASASIRFEAHPLEGKKNFWFGNFHSHTAFSDGKGTPEEAFAFARDLGDLDFYAVTDHAEKLDDIFDDGLAAFFPHEYVDIGSVADRYNEPGEFVALQGFEWSSLVFGHICVYEEDSIVSSHWLSRPQLSDFYSWIQANGALAQFNHPGRWGDFQDLALNEGVRENMIAIEVGNQGDGISDNRYAPYYIAALDKGWRVAPTNNQDNHVLRLTPHRSVYISEVLSRESLMEAMWQRRIYASDDPNTEIVFRSGEAWMGAEIARPTGPLTFSVKVEADEPIISLRILTNGGTPAAELYPEDTPTKVLWFPEVDVGDRSYFFLEVTEEDESNDDPDNSQQMAFTAPIWIAP